MAATHRQGAYDDRIPLSDPAICYQTAENRREIDKSGVEPEYQRCEREGR
jgi:hypothetical protein